MSQDSVQYLTVEEYLVREEVSTIRHEYVDGRVFAMTGTTLKHNTIVGNLYTATLMWSATRF